MAQRKFLHTLHLIRGRTQEPVAECFDVLSTDDLPDLTDLIEDAVGTTIHEGTASTTDGAITTVVSVPITADTTYGIEAHVVARRTGGSAGTADDGAYYKMTCMVTTKAGTVTASAVTSAAGHEDQVAWDATLDVSGTNLRVRVTGAANNNISWQATVYARPISS